MMCLKCNTFAETKCFLLLNGLDSHDVLCFARDNAKGKSALDSTMLLYFQPSYKYIIVRHGVHPQFS